MVDIPKSEDSVRKMADTRINYEQTDSWPHFNPLDYKCDVGECKAEPGEYCDRDRRGIHTERGIDELIRISQQRKLTRRNKHHG